MRFWIILKKLALFLLKVLIFITKIRISNRYLDCLIKSNALRLALLKLVHNIAAQKRRTKVQWKRAFSMASHRISQAVEKTLGNYFRKIS